MSGLICSMCGNSNHDRDRCRGAEAPDLLRRSPDFRRAKSRTTKLSYVATALRPEDRAGFAASGIMLWRAGTVDTPAAVLMVEEVRSGQQAFNFIGGKRDNLGETPEETGIRGLIEETLLDVTLSKYAAAITFPLVAWNVNAKYVLLVGECPDEYLDLPQRASAAITTNPELALTHKGRLIAVEWIQAHDLLESGDKSLHTFTSHIVRNLSMFGVLRTLAADGDLANYVHLPPPAITGPEHTLPSGPRGRGRGRGQRQGKRRSSNGPACTTEVETQTHNNDVALGGSGLAKKQTGAIWLFIGPMYSGKTTRMAACVERAGYAKKNGVIVKYVDDDRYTTGTTILTHAGIKLAHGCVIEGSGPKNPEEAKAFVSATSPLGGRIRMVSARNLADVKLASGELVVGIDEGQFYPDLVDVCEQWARSGRWVIVAALDGNWQRQPIGHTLALIPLAEKVEKLQAVCMDCGELASFTWKFAQASTQPVAASAAIEVCIGGAETYRSLCRECYNTARGN